MPCPICSWRRRLIRFAAEDDQTEETDAPANECDCSFPPVLELLHTDPGPLWQRIIMTDALKPPDLPQTRLGSHRLWVRIPLRIPEAEWTVNMSDCHCVFEDRFCNPDVYVEAFHNTRLQHLVGANAHGHGAGILFDRRMRFGVWGHNNNVGVNVYADGGLETFEDCRGEPTRGWVQLEVRCTNTTRLTGKGRRHRYCINGPSGQVCLKAALQALWVPMDELPPIVRLA